MMNKGEQLSNYKSKEKRKKPVHLFFIPIPYIKFQDPISMLSVLNKRMDEGMT